MTEITDEQRAAWRELRMEDEQGHNIQPLLDALVPLLPLGLTAPQPELPTQPGHYLDVHRDVVELTEEGEWYFHGARREVAEVAGYAPLTRLVPERPQIAREQIIGVLNELSAYSTGGQADAILALVNGADQ